jgi:hypothetical protein
MQQSGITQVFFLIELGAKSPCFIDVFNSKRWSQET